MREEAVQERGRGRHVAEKYVPVLRWSIGFVVTSVDTVFVTTDEDLKQVLGRVGFEPLHPEVLEHEGVDACELLDQIAPRGASSKMLRTAARRPANRPDRDGRGACLRRGEPDHVVESFMGHLSRRMLEHYSHIRLHAKKAALDRLDQTASSGPKKLLK